MRKLIGVMPDHSAPDLRGGVAAALIRRYRTDTVLRSFVVLAALTVIAASATIMLFGRADTARLAQHPTVKLAIFIPMRLGR